MAKHGYKQSKQCRFQLIINVVLLLNRKKWTMYVGIIIIADILVKTCIRL